MTLRTAVLGSGNIGCDLLCKIIRSEFLSCTKFVGRNLHSNGLEFARLKGIEVLDSGIDGLLENLDSFDLVFDATSANSHLSHANKLIQAGKTIINLTPAKIGEMCVPVLNGEDVIDEKNINMITCGGQASLPIVDAIKKVHSDVEYIEVVSSIAAKSAGPATRLNLNNYLETTEKAINYFSKCHNVKAVLNINPAKPNVDMQTAVSAIHKNADIEKIRAEVNKVVKLIQKYIKGYEIVVEPYVDGDRIFTMIRVKGHGDYLAPYAGNLDIITSSSINIAENIYHRQKSYIS